MEFVQAKGSHSRIGAAGLDEANVERATFSIPYMRQSREGVVANKRRGEVAKKRTGERGETRRSGGNKSPISLHCSKAYVPTYRYIIDYRYRDLHTPTPTHAPISHMYTDRTCNTFAVCTPRMQLHRVLL